MFNFHTLVLVSSYALLQHASATLNAPVNILPQPEKVDLYPKQQSQISPRVPPRCGEVLTAESGAIYYKPFEQVLDNERCAWIIGVSGAVGYTINVQYLGVPTNEPDSGQELVLTGVKRGAPDLAKFQPTEVGFFTVTDSNVVIVSFHSSTLNDRQSTGFVLQYEGLQTGNITKIPASSMHYILDLPSFEFKYPQHGGNYAGGELDAFIFPPGENIYAGHDKHVWYKKDGWDSYCYATMTKYRFNASSTVEEQKWQGGEKIACGAATDYISEDDMVLVIFQAWSNSNGGARGFWFWFTGC